ncbi:hypothetical protein SPSYN_02828 [Sporotomaculum syntrophicum]|uniref:DUF2889 domain-containing protein n=1 Tax=Sporotomaculum syntrophicum TaxID=182264 RepID=A0A9D2WNB4_9FIRM|nr:DUF2889 domain-containing protein [Sporotomaculum syntrophicum]KAF1083916.1 hypothetical protein SPSYN_02828 [Sporotomaculum syntrophicum]
MINIFQRHWHSSTRRSSPKPGNAAEGSAVIETGRQSNGQIIAETIYCDTDCEVGARLRVDPISFKIIEATWETYSLPVTITDVSGLRGVEAYFNSGRAISEAVAPLGPIAHTLFNETVGCVILSEPFMIKERGFASVADYREYWDVIYLNACRYYSNLDTASEQWDYFSYARTSILFNKFASQSVFARPGGCFRVVATYSDSFHEISVEFDMESNLVITRGAGGLLRAPHAICLEDNAFLPYLQQLAGYDAKNPVKKQLALVLGQGDGCVHLIDTVYDALVAANMAANRSS